MTTAQFDQSGNQDGCCVTRGASMVSPMAGIPESLERALLDWSLGVRGGGGGGGAYSVSTAAPMPMGWSTARTAYANPTPADWSRARVLVPVPLQAARDDGDGMAWPSQTSVVDLGEGTEVRIPTPSVPKLFLDD